jgi:hypothetical protein
MSKEAFTSFNKTYFSFLEFIKKYLKNDSNFKMFYRKNQIVKETNVKIIITMWNERITKKYYTQVMNKDFEFFLNKSYSEEITNKEKETPLLKYINDFKEIFPSLDETTKNEFLDYILNLTNYSYIYFNKSYK